MGQAATQLFSAVRDGDIATVKKLLIEKHVDVNVTDKDGGTALVWASRYGFMECVKVLLDRGADVNMQDNNGWSPLMVACKQGHLGIVKTLLETEANVNQANKDGFSPLMLACYRGHLDVLKTLIQAGANVSQANKNEVTGLFMASQEGHLVVVQTLLEAGAGKAVNIARSTDNTTPLYVACDKGHQEIVQILLAAGADVKIARSTDGWSPLMVASHNIHVNVVMKLIEAGANVNQTNKERRTALDIAMKHDCQGEHLVEVLKTYQSKVITDMRQQLCQLFDTKQHKEQTEQQLHDMKQEKVQLEQKIKDIMHEKELSEQTLHDVKQQKEQTDQKFLDLQQEYAIELYGMRQQKEKIELQLREAKQQKDFLELQVRQLASKANEKAIMSEQGLMLSRQMSEPHFRCAQNIPTHTEYLRSSWQVKRDEIKIIQEKPLGVGGWGEVKLAMFRGMKVAAKFMHEAIISSHTTHLFAREMDIAACIRHPNLLLFIGASLEDNKPIIITELMPANLRSIVHALSQDNVISIGTDVACGLNYLHLMKPDPIIHRDISSANVLVEPIGPISWRAKVSDYGSANYVSRVTTVGPGNSLYAAPESINPNIQSPKMDVYSYGILLLEMATGQFPEPALKMVQLDTLPWLSLAAKIKECICEDRDKRPSMTDILRYLKQFNK